MLLTSIKDFFTKGHERSIKAKKNILASFFLKGFSILIIFALVPLTLNYLNATRYGIWLTLSSFIGWLGFFDIGLGNGLRNKFAEALAKNDLTLAKTYLSTTYAILAIIIGILLLIFLLATPFLNWTKILNVSPDLANELSILVLVVFVFFALRFIFNLIGIVLIADQKPAINNSFGVISNLLALIIIFILTKTTSGSLLYLGLVLSVTPVIVLIFASLIFYKGSYRFCCPSVKYVKFKYFNKLANLGFKFFVIQIAALILFSTDNIIITQLFGPTEVTPYNIALKYFSLITMTFAIIMSPFWSAFTEAYIKEDFIWIKNIIKKNILVWLSFVFLTVLMLVFSNLFYNFWIGGKIKIPIELSVFMALYVIFRSWTSLFGSFLNGTGKIKLSLYISIIAASFNIPLSIFLAKYLELGISGVILATCICLLLGVVIMPIQYKKIVTNKAEGIWNK